MPKSDSRPPGPASLPETIDLDAFYSAPALGDWQAILGDGLHYHFGDFRGHEDLTTGVEQAVRRLYPYIPRGTRVLDLGCGWGGPALMLQREHDCAVVGVTISQAQADLCRRRNLEVLRLDMEVDALPGSFDVALLMESLEHIRDRVGLLARLHKVASKLVFQTNCGFSGRVDTDFGGSMRTFSPDQLHADLVVAGWEVSVWENVRFASLRTATLWQQNLQAHFGTQLPPGQLTNLSAMLQQIHRNPIQWAIANPLIIGVARSPLSLAQEQMP